MMTGNWLGQAYRKLVDVVDWCRASL